MLIWFAAGGVLAFELASGTVVVWIVFNLASALYLEWGMWFGTKDVRDYEPDIEQERQELGSK